MLTFEWGCSGARVSPVTALSPRTRFLKGFTIGHSVLTMESSLEAVNFGKSIIIPSVQEMAKESMIKIPPRYERPDQDPPIISTDASPLLSSIPVIDLERLAIEDSMDSELDILHSACREWGFFQA